MADENEEVLDEEPKAPSWDDLDEAHVETIARLQGWNPDKETVNGPKLSALDYVKSLPDRHTKLTRKFNESDHAWQARLDQMEKRLNSVTSVFDRTVQSAYERGLSEAQAEMKEAVANADGDAFDRAQRKMEDLKANAPKAETPEAPQEMPAHIQGWITENQVIFQNPAWARRISEIDYELADEGLPPSISRFEEAKRRLLEEDPQVPGHRVRRKPQTVETPKQQPSEGKNINRQFGQLGDEYKAAFEEFWDAGNYKGMTKDQAKAKYMEFVR